MTVLNSNVCSFQNVRMLGLVLRLDLQTQLGHRTANLALEVYAKTNEDKTRKAEKEYDEYLCKKLGTSD